MCNNTRGLLGENHSPDNLAVGKATSHNLDDADIVDVKVDGVLGHDGENSLGHQGGKEVLVAGLLRGDDGAEGFGKFGC